MILTEFGDLVAILAQRYRLPETLITELIACVDRAEIEGTAAPSASQTERINAILDGWAASAPEKSEL